MWRGLSSSFPTPAARGMRLSIFNNRALSLSASFSAASVPRALNPSKYCTNVGRTIHSFSARNTASSSPSSSSPSSSSSNTNSGTSSNSELESAFADLFAESGSSSSGSSAGSVSESESIGEVVGVNRGIVSIDHLPTAHVGACVELLDGEDDTRVSALALVLSIHSESIKAMLLGVGEESVTIGHKARHTVGHVPALNVDDVESYAGAVIDPLGRVLDPSSLEPIINSLPKRILLPTLAQTDASQQPLHDSEDPVETHCFPLLTTPPAPLSHRSTAHQFLPTGLMHLDAFHPIAEGLRIGLFGAKRTGKSTMAATLLDSFAQQLKHAQSASDDTASAKSSLLASPIPSPFHFIYVSIGQSRSEVQQLIATLRKNGAMDYSTVIVATNEQGMGMQYLAPFMGATLSDYYRNVLHESSFIVYDDLSAHGHLLTSINRFYGYPILAPNFVHAKLLERVAPLDESAGGASSTAIVLVETNRADRTLDINENLSGFVDHAIWLDANLAAKGVFPSINVGSVLGRPAARYRPHVLRSLTSSLSSQILQSERKSNTARWAGEFGFESEEEDIPLLEFKDKCQFLLSQRHAEKLVSLTDQLVLLYAMQKDAALLGTVSFDQIRSYSDSLMKELKQGTASSLYKELDEQVRSANIANSTQHKEQPSNSVLALETVAAQHDSATPIETITSKPAASTSLWQRLDDFIGEFNRKFAFGK